MFNRILVAYDGTLPAKSAFEQAARLAMQAHRPLHLVAVAWTAEVETRADIERKIKRYQSMLRDLCERSRSVGLEIEIEVIEGVPYEQIVNAATRFHADLLVIGHRRRGLMYRFAELSVAKRVIDRAPCPVMVAN